MHTAYEPAINEVVVPVLNRDLCNEWLDTLNVTEGMLCAGYEVKSIQFRSAHCYFYLLTRLNFSSAVVKEKILRFLKVMGDENFNSC